MLLTVPALFNAAAAAAQVPVIYFFSSRVA